MFKLSLYMMCNLIDQIFQYLKMHQHEEEGREMF